MSVDLQRVGLQTCEVGESPLWSEREQAWLWVDIAGHAIWRYDPASGALRSWATEEMPACLTLTDDGGLIAGMESGIFAVTLEEGGLAGATRLAGVEHARGNMRFNDGRCDRQGRFWSGTMYMDMSEASAVGQLYRYGAGDAAPQPLIGHLVTQNGLSWSPDGRTMYLSDSHPTRRLIWTYDFDPNDGVPTDGRLFVDMRHYAPGRPDGAAMDVDGCYWICANDGGELLRFTPAGRLDRRIPVPMAKPAMCAFGGSKRDTLLVTSIGAQRKPGDQWAGAVITLQPGVQGMPEPLFRT